MTKILQDLAAFSQTFSFSSCAVCVTFVIPDCTLQHSSSLLWGQPSLLAPLMAATELLFVYSHSKR